MTGDGRLITVQVFVYLQEDWSALNEEEEVEGLSVTAVIKLYRFFLNFLRCKGHTNPIQAILIIKEMIFVLSFLYLA